MAIEGLVDLERIRVVADPAPGAQLVLIVIDPITGTEHHTVVEHAVGQTDPRRDVVAVVLDHVPPSEIGKVYGLGEILYGRAEVRGNGVIGPRNIPEIARGPDDLDVAGCRIEPAKPVVAADEVRLPIVADADVQREIGRDLPVILEKVAKNPG